MQRVSNVVVRLGAAALLSVPLAAIAQVPPPLGRPGMEMPRMPMDASSPQDLASMHAEIYGGIGPEGPAIPPPEQLFAGADPIGALRHPLLRGLKLDEAQGDKVFEILHAQAPAVRNATKALRKANEDLRALALSGGYDAAKARALADAASRAAGELALLRADVDHKVWEVLTAEQRRQAEAIRRPPWVRP